jgi:hypothetical protein
MKLTFSIAVQAMVIFQFSVDTVWVEIVHIVLQEWYSYAE